MMTKNIKEIVINLISNYLYLLLTNINNDF